MAVDELRVKVGHAGLVGVVRICAEGAFLELEPVES